MAFFQKLFAGRRRRRERLNALCNEYITKMEYAKYEYNALFFDENTAVDPALAKVWRAKNTALLAETEHFCIKDLERADRFQKLLDTRHELSAYVKRLDAKIEAHNSTVLQKEKEEKITAIGNVEGHTLDPQQIECILADAKNQLVVAGAGTGKTTTIIGKVKHLLQTGKYTSDQILVLSFTNASAAEMRERLQIQTGAEITVSTFHKLGLDIITKATGKTPKLTSLSLHEWIPERLSEFLSDTDYAGAYYRCFSEENVTEDAVSLLETVINLMKNGGYTPEKLGVLLEKRLGAERSVPMMAVITPLYERYQMHLEQECEIDFHDMIALATGYVRKKKVENPYRYVIVDEYQDISASRYRLLASLRKNADFSLFCVGDDWQSIYRFAGSDLDYLLRFEKYWGETRVDKIETTYRFPPSLAEVSGDFIMQNPLQIQKNISSTSRVKGFSLSLLSGDTEQEAVLAMAQTLEKLPKKSTVFLIGRYLSDRKMLESLASLEVTSENLGITEYSCAERGDLSICFMTAHKAKGLQADYVFILNNKSGTMGFPSRVTDHEIARCLLASAEKYPSAEERRLFYVAMTRAKKKVCFLTVKNAESPFMEELRERYPKKLK